MLTYTLQSVEDVLTALLATLGVTLAPLASWLSQRWTREGRLTARINRLGTTCLVLPLSEERTTLESEVLRSVRELNKWLEPDRRGLRVLQRAIGVTLFCLAVWGLFLLSREDLVSEAALLAISVVAGLVIAVVLLVSETAFGRFLVKRRAEIDMQTKLGAFSRGEPLT